MDKNELNKLVTSYLQSKDKKAIAELIVEYVQPQHLTTELVSMFINTRSLKPGDALVKKVRKGITVRTLVPGSIHLASEVTVSDRINYVLDGADVKVSYSEWDMENGDIGTIEDIRKEMAAKLADYYVSRVFNALASVWTLSNTPDNFMSVGGNLTPAALEAGINRINQTTPGAKIIVGTRKALAPTTKFISLRDASNNAYPANDVIDEIYKTGKLGMYYGVPILALDQVYDNPEDYKPMIPDDKVLVIGENIGEFITFGEPRWKEWVDMNPTPPQWFIEVYQQFGMIVDNAQGVYVIGDLS